MPANEEFIEALFNTSKDTAALTAHLREWFDEMLLGWLDKNLPHIIDSLSETLEPLWTEAARDQVVKYLNMHPEVIAEAMQKHFE